MMVAFNTVSNFPGDYNGGDPLAAKSPDAVRHHVGMMIRAVAGDMEAKLFFQDPKNLIYCAELAHVSTSAGLLVPLNAANVVPLVGQETWDAFKAELDRHNAGDPSGFTTGNANVMLTQVKIELTLADESLLPAPDYAPADIQEQEKTKLAFRPMTMADIVEQFMRTHVPREQMGEQLAPAQGQMLEMMKPGLLEAMGMDQIPAEDPRRQAVELLFAKLVETTGRPYGNYAEFRQALAPLMDQARTMTGPRDDSGTGLFVPPSLLHVITQGKHTGGLIGLTYEGHGVAVQATKKKADPTEPAVQSRSVEPQEPMAGSCSQACGGFSPDLSCACDDVCETNGDCCPDVNERCRATPR